MVTKEVEPNNVRLGQPPGSRPDPDPTLRTMELVERAIVQLESKLDIRIGSIEKAITLQHDDLVRVPTEVQKVTGALRELVESKLDKQIEVSEERFKGVQAQFVLLGKATEQLDVANKTAIAAALQAQKESAGETQKTSQAAIAKAETSTSESIKALTSAFNAAILSATDRINDLKGRLDRGEGKTSVTDPAIGAALAELSQGIKGSRASEPSWPYIFAAITISIIIAAAIVLAKHLT